MQITLKDQHCSHLIYNSFVLAAGQARGVQMTVSLGRRKPFIPQVDRQSRLLMENFCKGLRLCGLRALVSGHIKRVSDNNGGAVVPADQALKRFEVLPAIGADQCKHRLRRKPQRVGYSDTNAPVADVEAHDSRCSFIHEDDDSGDS